jgi:hypothetical protein
VPVGSGWESQDVLLNFDNAIVLFSAVDSRLKADSITYSKMNRLEYSHTKGHRKIGVGIALAANSSLFHWC